LRPSFLSGQWQCHGMVRDHFVIFIFRSFPKHGIVQLAAFRGSSVACFVDDTFQFVGVCTTIDANGGDRWKGKTRGRGSVGRGTWKERRSIGAKEQRREGG
jgi:hypothetical protein